MEFSSFLCFYGTRAVSLRHRTMRDDSIFLIVAICVRDIGENDLGMPLLAALVKNGKVT